MNKVLIKKEVEVSLEWLEHLISEYSKDMTQVSLYSEMSINKMLWFKLTVSLKENDLNVVKTYIVKFPPLHIERVLYKDDYYPDWSAYDKAEDKILTMCRIIVGWDNVLVSYHWSMQK